MITITPQNFQSDILRAKHLALVVFGGDWCIPSRQLLDLLDEIEPDLSDSVVIGSVNVENETAMTRQWEVKGTPTMILFYKGEPVASRLGVGTEETIRDWLTEHLRKVGL